MCVANACYLLLCYVLWPVFACIFLLMQRLFLIENTSSVSLKAVEVLSYDAGSGSFIRFVIGDIGASGKALVNVDEEKVVKPNG